MENRDQTLCAGTDYLWGPITGDLNTQNVHNSRLQWPNICCAHTPWEHFAFLFCQVLVVHAPISVLIGRQFSKKIIVYPSCSETLKVQHRKKKERNGNELHMSCFNFLFFSEAGRDKPCGPGKCSSNNENRNTGAEPAIAR